jgi:fumarate hydratase class II
MKIKIINNRGAKEDLYLLLTGGKQKGIKGITPNKKHITELLDGSFVAATDYSESLGYEVVAEAVVKALKTGKTLKEILGK